MTTNTVRKHLRLYPQKYPDHQAILDWLRTRRGSGNENLIYLMTLGLKVAIDEIPQDGNTPQTAVRQQDNLLPEIRKIVSAPIQDALRNTDIQISQEDQEKLPNEKTQAFLIDMADNF